ncbi:MAG: serine/threonine protein kinase [Ruminococcaceae bacterium]|nr:serine/threonine protein kinase [Oscillospiraceae bacterium]
MLDPNRLCLGCMNELEEENKTCEICGWNNKADENKSHQLKCGTVLQGKYLVGKVLGEGGFGITYLGYNLILQEKVAIKEFYPHGFVGREITYGLTVEAFDGKEAFVNKSKDAFIKEAKTMSNLNRVNGIVEMRDVFSENQSVYIVMEYVEGQTLKDYVKQNGNKLPMSTVLKLLEPVMDALEQVHAHNLIHRDISPDNIMVGPDGRVTLLDLGAARQISADGGHSLTVNVKHGYAPMEQYQTHGEQGPWTDIYALCATIYRLITGKVPPSAADRALDDGLIRPSVLGTDITEEQEKVLLKGLAVRSAERYLNIFELHEAFIKAANKTDEKTVPINSEKNNRKINKIFSDSLQEKTFNGIRAESVKEEKKEKDDHNENIFRKTINFIRNKRKHKTKQDATYESLRKKYYKDEIKWTVLLIISLVIGFAIFIWPFINFFIN